LREARQERFDTMLERGTKLMIEGTYQSHMTYRGRDFGVAQAGYTPGLTFYHKSGLSVSIAPTWYEKTYVKWNELNVSGSFEKDFSSLWSGSLYYEHIWFADTNFRAREDLNNSITFALTMRPGHAMIRVTSGFDFGLRAEMNYGLITAYTLDLQKILFMSDVTLEPTLTALYGQDGEYFFGVLDYEVSIPLNIQIGIFSILPAITYTVPLNVKDSSRNRPFFIASIDANCAIVF
jgi:hypothetical protein